MTVAVSITDPRLWGGLLLGAAVGLGLLLAALDWIDATPRRPRDRRDSRP